MIDKIVGAQAGHDGGVRGAGLCAVPGCRRFQGHSMDGKCLLGGQYRIAYQALAAQSPDIFMCPLMVLSASCHFYYPMCIRIPVSIMLLRNVDDCPSSSVA